MSLARTGGVLQQLQNNRKKNNISPDGVATFIAQTPLAFSPPPRIHQHPSPGDLFEQQSSSINLYFFAADFEM